MRLRFVATVLALTAVSCTHHEPAAVGGGNPAPESQFGSSGTGKQTPAAGAYTPTTGTDLGNPAGEAGQTTTTEGPRRSGVPASKANPR